MIFKLSQREINDFEGQRFHLSYKQLTTKNIKEFLHRFLILLYLVKVLLERSDLELWILDAVPRL